MAITTEQMTLLQKERLKWKQEIPFELYNIGSLEKVLGAHLPCAEPVLKAFPNTTLLPNITFELGSPQEMKNYRVGILFSGGQAPGGHNVVAGLLDGIQQIGAGSTVVGFLNGPKGLMEGKRVELTVEKVAPYRNQGGFDLLGSGREKIETEEQFKRAQEAVVREKLDGLVIVGGDDSNTTAAFLAEYFAREKVDCSVMGVPKTIDGDLRGPYVQIPFGYDTACKTYAELIGNIARDMLSAKKYYAFIRLMGRSASHITLQCALMTHPNLAFIREEVEVNRRKLSSLVGELCDLVIERAKAGKNYGVILIPEGLVEAIPDFELEPFLKDLDPHGNIKVSHIESERFLIDRVQKELKSRNAEVKFSGLPFFLGYEGRSGFPSNFDANYTYSLGLAAAVATRQRANGYLVTLQGLKSPAQEWTVLLHPLTQMLGLEKRDGQEKIVIKKSLVDFKGSLYRKFEEQRFQWRLEDNYRYTGPIQYFGSKQITDTVVEF